MKILKLVPAASLLLVVLGCDKSTDANYSDATSTPTRAERETTNGIAATSREGTASRIYGSDNTNANSAKAADNTGRNVRDRDNATLTAGDQPENEADRNITQAVRKAIMANDQLSTTAKNIKIITVNGKVTLRGPVKDAQEQQAIEAAVKGVTGVASVDNQVEVKTLNQ
jgi:osmotically-inducible protein OsmY